jgi:chemotaxis signal transduction protein
MPHALVPSFKGSDKSDELIQLVSFNLGSEEYGVEVLMDQEIVAGVINRAERLLVMLDLDKIDQNEYRQLLAED